MHARWLATCCEVVGAANVADAVTTLCYKTSLKYHMRCMTNVWWGGEVEGAAAYGHKPTASLISILLPS